MCAYQIFYRMNGTRVYTDDVFQVTYEWIYTRRPDGTLFRRGDCWIEREATSSYNAWRDHYGADLMTDIYGDPYIKLDYTICNPNNNKYTWENNTITPV